MSPDPRFSPSPRKLCRLVLATLPTLVAMLLALVATSALAQLPPPPAPPGNPVTLSKANLGKVLFWDEQLSSTRTVSCGTCHIPANGGADPRSLSSPLAIHPGPDGIFGNADDVFGSPGVPMNEAGGLYLWNSHFGLTEQVTPRRTTSSINAGYSRDLFWDGRAGQQFVDPQTMAVVLPNGAALESQAVGPITSDVEMANVSRVWSEVLTRIDEVEPLALATDVPIPLLKWMRGRSYAEMFEDAFGSPGIDAGRVGMAIASYERTQFTNQSPFDTFLATGSGLTPQESAGRTVFLASSCDRCHQVEIMTDNAFHYTGVRPPADDPGRFDVTGNPDDMGRMRTPSLRNLELRAPYMHNGRFATIEDVVEFYNRGGDFTAPNKDERVRELFLTQQQKDDLVAFLSRPLIDPRLVGEEGPFARPSLYTETSRVPSVAGSGGLPGSGALVPQVVALEPALIGNPSFTVGVFDGLGAANALLVIDDVDPGFTTPVAGDFAFESLVLDGTGAGSGFASVSLPIPNDAALEGSHWFGRWYIEDTGGGEAAAVSPLFEFTVFGGLGYVFADDFESGTLASWTSSAP